MDEDDAEIQLRAGQLLARLRRLLAGQVGDPAREAQWLLRHALGGDQRPLRDAQLSRAVALASLRLARRRRSGEPLAYVLGEQEFFGHSFGVGPAVLIPRPETEHLVEEALARGALGWIADVGTGSGAVGLTLLLERPAPQLRVVGIDASAKALATARANARRHSLEDRFRTLQGDLLAAIRPRSLSGVVANPPYVEARDYYRLPAGVRDREPREALVPAGGSPADLRERLLRQAMDALLPGGFVAVEVGAGQAGHAWQELRSQGFHRLKVRNDLASIGRIVSGVKPADAPA